MVAAQRVRLRAGLIIGGTMLIAVLTMCQSAQAQQPWQAQSQAQAHLSIIQVLYDPIKTESGGEFILLENKGNESVNISSWTVATASSPKDVIIPKNTALMGPGMRFLIADKGWNESRDNLSWPLADLEATMTMANTNSGVALLNNGSQIDAVGWGNVSNSLLFQGIPARPAGKGESLRRVAFTGSNADDFVSSLPVFDGMNPQGGLDITVTVEEPEIQPTNLSVVVEDDDPQSGYQLTPFPGARRLVKLNLTVKGSSPDEVNVEAWGQQISINKTNIKERMEVSLPLPYFILPGNYSLDVSGLRSRVVISIVHAKVSIAPVLSISLDTPQIQLGKAFPGSTVMVKGDENISTLDRPTIWNSGNVQAGLSVLGTELVAGSQAIPPSMIDVDLTRSQKAFNAFSMASTTRDVGALFDVQSIAGLDVSIRVPDVPAGAYRGRIWLLATNGGAS